MKLDAITDTIVDESIRIHRGLGSAVFESVYEVVLAAALERRQLRVDRQVPIGFSYDGMDFDIGFRADLVVEECVIVEIKSIERLAPIHTRQLLTYLRLSRLRVGLLLNFGAGMMKEGIKRVVNDLDPFESPRLRINNPHS